MELVTATRRCSWNPVGNKAVVRSQRLPHRNATIDPIASRVTRPECSLYLPLPPITSHLGYPFNRSQGRSCGHGSNPRARARFSRVFEVADAHKWVRYQDLIGTGEPRQHPAGARAPAESVACRSPPARGEQPHGELRLHGYPRPPITSHRPAVVQAVQTQALHTATVEGTDFANFDAAVLTQRWRLPASCVAGRMSARDRLTTRTERADTSIRQDLSEAA